MRSFFIIAFLFVCCLGCKQHESLINIDNLAIEYVKLGLTIGQYDPDFVDAYYGPDSLKPLSAPKHVIPKDSLLAATDSLKTKLERIILSPQTDNTISIRARWIMKQLIAFNMSIRNFAGERVSFEEEVFQLFDVKFPQYNEQYFKDLLTELDKVLPGEGTIRERYKNLSDRFIIPKEKVDTLFKVTINEARRRTKENLRLPEGETYTLELVTNKPWSGYNWYKGNYISLIQINTDLPIRIDKAIDLVCHEGYPGHHVYNAMLEKNLAHDKGWLEVSFYPLFSPQTFIAEGTANFGIEMVLPESEYR